MSIREMARAGAHLLEHVGMVVIGSVLVVVGLALTVTAVFTVLGIVLLCVGVGLVVVGIWAHQMEGP
jgi:uncharacterized membrane protein HdeD (DUF308 family)